MRARSLACAAASMESLVNLAELVEASTDALIDVGPAETGEGDAPTKRPLLIDSAFCQSASS